MRRDVNQAREELWLRYAKEKAIRRRRERRAVVGVAVLTCVILSCALPAAITKENTIPLESSQMRDDIMLESASPDDGTSEDEIDRGYSDEFGPMQSTVFSLNATDVLSFKVIGLKNAADESDEYSSEILSALKNVLLRSRDEADDSPTAVELVIVENEKTRELYVTADCTIVLDGEYYDVIDAAALFEIFERAGAKFNYLK